MKKEDVNEENRPKLFYKYHKINENLTQLITKKTFWFCEKDDLNDHFECKFTISDKLRDQLFEDTYLEFADKIIEIDPKTQWVKNPGFKNNMLGFIKSEEEMNSFYNMWFHFLPIGVCCFTTDNLNEIMWAHYADSGKGICLEFDMTLNPELGSKIFPVTYTNQIPDLESRDQYIDTFFRKNVCWSIENEWRIIADPGVKSFNKESLKAIIFGPRVGIEEIARIRDLLIESGYKDVQFKNIGIKINNHKFKKLDVSDFLN